MYSTHTYVCEYVCFVSVCVSASVQNAVQEKIHTYSCVIYCTQLRSKRNKQYHSLAFALLLKRRRLFVRRLINTVVREDVCEAERPGVAYPKLVHAIAIFRVKLMHEVRERTRGEHTQVCLVREARRRAFVCRL